MMKADNIIEIADKIESVARLMTFTADHIDFRGFTDINGFTVDTSGNLTIDGVVNNNLMVITSANVYDRFSHYGNQTWLDPSMLGSIVKLDSSLAQLTIQLPWMNYDSGEGYKQGTDAKLTLDEMRRCIGKKFVIYSEGIGHNFQCGTQDDQRGGQHLLRPRPLSDGFRNRSDQELHEAVQHWHQSGALD